MILEVKSNEQIYAINLEGSVSEVLQKLDILKPYTIVDYKKGGELCQSSQMTN